MKIINKLTAFVLAVVLLLSFSPAGVQAAGGLKKLTSGKTYKSYDFTGDGKADSLKCVTKNSGGAGYVNVFLKGRKIQKIDLARGGMVYAWKVSKKKSYLVMTAGGFGFNSFYVYAYENEKFKIIASEEGPLDYLTPYKATSSVLTVKSDGGKHQRIFGGDKPTFLVKYKIENGTLEFASRYAAVTGKKKTFTAAKAFKTSSSAVEDNTGGVKVKKGAKVKMKKIYIYYEDYTYEGQTHRYAHCNYLISVNGKKGWIKDSSDVGNVLFK